MLEEVPLPSIPSPPPEQNKNPSSPDYLNYFSLLESYHPEYFDDLPSEIMNHFRTSTPRPYYETEEPRTIIKDYASHPPPVTCLQDADTSFVSPCNPHLPSFSLSELSLLSMQGYRPQSPEVREPTQLQPPSGRIPYPTFRPEYEDLRDSLEPLMYTPRQYVPSSTIRPMIDVIQRQKTRKNIKQMKKSSIIENKITTYRPKFSLKSTTEVNEADDISMKRIKDRLAEIIEKLREKERSGEQTNLANLHDWYQQRRKNGQRYYPDNDINPHLPVTSHPPAQSTKIAPKANQPLNPDDYFTVKNRKISGAAKLPNSSLLLWTIVVIQTIMITCTAHYLP